ALIPGISTIDDLLALRDIPEKFQPERTGYDSISTGGAALWFSNGILESKSDPRTKLGEILAHYGPPDKVLWQLPSYDNDHPVEDTILLYPEHNGFFYGRDKVITFSPNSEFHSLFFSSQEDYLLYTSVNFETDRFELFIESAWPCDD
ncbi:MAG: hypothetical protein GWN00_11060, partial [Aliifodinibius sp.]|nr:hypothetical protein [Fodinibius sp.]NIV11709.1 hypothetical protein [Fodinibius sp.]NIY25325.1 hypothetical protein [Fodinibius sp.]